MLAAPLSHRISSTAIRQGLLGIMRMTDRLLKTGLQLIAVEHYLLPLYVRDRMSRHHNFTRVLDINNQLRSPAG
jgi:hypothetical protein